jgi:hypothetical protein
MKKLPNWVLGALVVTAGVAMVAMFPANLAQRAEASVPTADEVSFCHADASGASDATGIFVIRASSGVYSQHRRHGDCLVADGTPAGDTCSRVDVDHDELCDQNGDPGIGD